MVLTDMFMVMFWHATFPALPASIIGCIFCTGYDLKFFKIVHKTSSLFNPGSSPALTASFLQWLSWQLSLSVDFIQEDKDGEVCLSPAWLLQG